MGWQKIFHLWRTDFCWKLCSNMGNLETCQGHFFLKKQRNISDSFEAWILACRDVTVVITPINIFNWWALVISSKGNFVTYCQLGCWCLLWGSVRSHRAAKERKETWSSEVNRGWLKHQKPKMFGVWWQNESKPTAEHWCHPVLICLLERCHFSKFLVMMGHSKGCSYNIKWVLFEEKLRWVRKWSCLSSKFLSFVVQKWTQRCQVTLHCSGVLGRAEGETNPFPLQGVQNLHKYRIVSYDTTWSGCRCV